MTDALVSKVPDSTSDVLARTIHAVLEALTGVAAADRKHWYLSIGRILQSVRGARFLNTLKREWDNYRAAGRIPDDYESTEQHKECLQEILDFLDDASPDEARFEMLKKIFLFAATETQSTRDEVLPQQYMRLVRQITAGEAIVLSASYELGRTTGTASEWLIDIAARSGLKHKELVELHEDGLVKKRLLVPRAYADGSGIQWSGFGRLTSLGHNLCEFMKCADQKRS